MPSAHATHDHTKYRISVKPETATNTVGEEHCVTATVRDTGHGGPNSGHQPVVGVAVQFTVTGANSTSGTGVTNASGEATFCYIGTKAGTDNITAFADRDADKTLDAGEPSASVKKTWVPGPAAKIVLEPAAATNTTGQQHCVTATVTDAFGNPIANAAVVFSVTGANPRAATVKTTDASGKATFCYTGANAGQDVITAFVDTDKDNTKDLTEPVGTATKTYVAPTVTLSPLVATEPVTEKRTVIPGVGLPKRSVTVAVTQCSSPTTFVAVFSLRTSVAGGPGSYVFVAMPVGSPTSGWLLPFASTTALIVSTPAFVPV